MQIRKSMMFQERKQSIFQCPIWVTVFALIAAIVWGWAYPLIKIGFREFQITTSMTGSKMLFAGVRFFISGLIILVIAQRLHRSFSVSKTSDYYFIFVYSLLNTTLHYAFFYFGLSHSQGSRAALLNSLGVFAVVILACLFFKSDKMTKNKLFGCIIGFAGLAMLNLGDTSKETDYSILGDNLIVLNALCSAFASLLTRSLSHRVDIFVGTGYSLALGGALLVVFGLLAGGTFPISTTWGVVILLLLIGISTTGFALYNKLISCNPVGKIAIYNSLIPIIGAISSCLCLNETFYWKYVLAGTFATIGIYIINRSK